MKEHVMHKPLKNMSGSYEHNAKKVMVQQTGFILFIFMQNIIYY